MYTLLIHSECTLFSQNCNIQVCAQIWDISRDKMQNFLESVQDPHDVSGPVVHKGHDLDWA